MRSDQQTDWMRDDPQRLAKVWREAGDTARQQFPNDTARHAHYYDTAARIEREAREMRDEQRI